MSIKRISLPYCADSSTLFAKIRQLPWAVFLDSNASHFTRERFDILSACPYQTLVTHGHETTIQTADSQTISTADPLALLQQAVQQHSNQSDDLPFTGGAIATFSYELARRFEHLPTAKPADLIIPELAAGLYDWAIINDHHQQQSQLIAANTQTETAALCQQILSLLKQPAPIHPVFELTAPIQSNFTKAQYQRAFTQVTDYINQGDCYELNLTQRFATQFTGSPWSLYQAIRATNPAPFASYFSLPKHSVLSFSPERFLQIINQTVTTSPIKGTIARSDCPVEDKKRRQDLQKSTKDRAENLMIVDLMRNDLSRVCELGSVQVPKLFAVESFPAIHHLVSTITGQLTDAYHPLDCLRACFPGGSITGAPKIRAMEIINTIEPNRRDLYCGSIGYSSFNGNFDSNIAIRTLVCQQNQLVFSAGGAIVADSQVEAEYQECFSKIQLIQDVLTEGVYNCV